ncbi:hypothetical protein NHH03_01635 [Stieleria sp. TO1_6]|uniref:hypothetical protein n=1 Tax=Stieleria tagensis TaxID=2956795 RepID=UPI00209B6A39|nr:hypothetical protein [Stieleria tagensis]MCO8120421.1 hypothetical protein [Stieleria tagensis]
MSNYGWTDNKKYKSTGYGLWEIYPSAPSGYSDVHVTMNFPEYTSSNKAWSWPHVTLITTGGTKTHVYIKRNASGNAIYVNSRGGSYSPIPGVKTICDKIVADFREYGIPCEYLGSKNDHTRKF